MYWPAKVIKYNRSAINFIAQHPNEPGYHYGYSRGYDSGYDKWYTVSEMMRVAKLKAFL
jgi:hypothetical protein